ncbi:MAG: glycosyltransferase family 1 protein [Chthoniobacter sp.]|nr:glycosyltransferase family 1 protein [Chthoniobacter sp.]
MAAPIFINGRFATQRQTGVQRFARQVVLAIDALLDRSAYQAARDRVTLVVPSRARADLPPLRHVRIVRGGWFGAGYAWEQFDLPRLSAGGVLLNLCNLGPVAKRRQVVVVHDATLFVSPESFSWPFRLAYRVLIPVLGRMAREIVTISRFSRDEIVRWYGLPARKVGLCGESGEHILSVAADASVLVRHGLAGRRFFLAVGVGSPNKNVDLVVEAFGKADLADTCLVLTGQRNTRVHPGGSVAASARVLSLGQVSDAELRALYEAAIALVYPSRYEGFGLPPLEAMGCGCPVVVSDQAALMEVVGNSGAAAVCGMDDADGLAVLMGRLAGDAAFRCDLAGRGQAHAATFRWADAAAGLLGRSLAMAE